MKDVENALRLHAGTSHIKIKYKDEKRITASYSPARKILIDFMAEEIEGGVNLAFSPAYSGLQGVLWLALIIIGLIAGIVPGILLIIFYFFSKSRVNNEIQKSIDNIINEIEFQKSQ